MNTMNGFGIRAIAIRENARSYWRFRPAGNNRRALWARWGPSTYVGGDYWCTRTKENGADITSLRSLVEVQAMWREQGIDGSNDDLVIFYCGTGWRSSLAFLLARCMGWKNVCALLFPIMRLSAFNISLLWFVMHVLCYILSHSNWRCL